ncbi:MAG: type II toxin-antitoxin system HicB family antitoxin [Desulfamplus sp.]|nr:type II toxin-antitoxin system HicB family antitoxin [Desulfamplus sp.]
MKYPVLIHKDTDSEFGVTLPDIPGCFTAGKTINEALKNLQEAVVCYYDGENINVPPEVSKIEDLVKRKDLHVKDGFWLLADIDFSFLSKKTVRIKITIPEYKLAMIDRAAEKRGLTRSAFLINATEEIL